MRKGATEKTVTPNTMYINSWQSLYLIYNNNSDFMKKLMASFDYVEENRSCCAKASVKKQIANT